ncbi:metal-dependent hydrolase [Flavobacteriaceae bacterium]|nr:metal-dependent hydrolase [Flavobacteriaceae bacterium]
MEIRFLGHACLSIETQGKKIIVDPFISGNALAKHIDIDKLEADYILITHAHEDHILDVERIAKNTGARIVSNFEIVDYYSKKGFEGHPMNFGGAWEFDFGKLYYVTAQHSSVFPDGTYGGNPGGFVLLNEEANIYIAGDTALMMDMKLIPLFAKLDLAVLPIGDNFTMGVDQAVMAAEFVNCDRVLGYHYDTFGYIEIDHEQAIRKFNLKDKELDLLSVGDFIEL